MCLRVTVVIPSNSNLNAVQEISKQHGFSFDVINNAYVLNQLSENEIYLGDADNNCECYTGIGAYELYNRDISNILKEFNDEYLIRQLSEEDIQKKETYKAEVNKWILLMKKLINDNYVSRIGILLHFYHDASDKEEIVIQDKIYLKLNDADLECLMKVKENIIYYFTQ